jgi:hypothetical protein
VNALPRLVAAHAREALRRGEPLSALSALGPSRSPDALALKGIALSQCGDLSGAAKALRQAVTGLSRARDDAGAAQAEAALAEVRLAQHADLDAAERALSSARFRLRRVGDARNRAWVDVLLARLRLLRGNTPHVDVDVDVGVGVDDRRSARATAPEPADTALAVAAALTAVYAHRADCRFGQSHRACDRARGLAAGHPQLTHDVERAAVSLSASAAMLSTRGADSALSPADAERWLHRMPSTWVVDGFRRRLLRGSGAIDFVRKPVAFVLLCELARVHPGEASAQTLSLSAFGHAPRHDEDRVKLRVNLSRLRQALPRGLKLEAGPNGWTLATAAPVVWVHPARAEGADRLEQLLWTGGTWSARALSQALEVNARTVQRWAAELNEQRRADAFGKGPATRYAIATSLLLPATGGPLIPLLHHTNAALRGRSEHDGDRNHEQP